MVAGIDIQANIAIEEVRSAYGKTLVDVFLCVGNVSLITRMQPGITGKDVKSGGEIFLPQ
jgi:hypothetical protein